MLYIMRHGKTEWNELRKLQGQTDIPLNEEGCLMAQAAHDKYINVHFDLCFSSPLKRAAQTAEILLNGRDVPIIADDRLKEMSFGEYEGTVNYAEDPDCEINVLFKEPEAYKEVAKGAETLAELFERVDSFLSQKVLSDVSKGKDILIVGHKVLNSAIICRINKLPLSEFWNNDTQQCKLLRLI